jgi:WD40 repeat protein
VPTGPEGINVWDLTAGKLRQKLGGHWNHLGALSFSADGKKLASIALMGGVIKIWTIDDVPAEAD